ncbi:hypothetical protein [Porphyromonas canoris]|uniref:Uncharacterized protein n=1 Tax=Porphyromonas canoris TaxID=36875 RepID=A0ABR4XJ74_9PORP|nr:hypothetical protein [Porphyromonas canoris]KGN91753.1 hypothetical protein HQ43_06560 [Porphyromonas canoris]
MNKVASSFSLSAYDFLAVLIPGGIILSSIIYSPYFKNLIRTSTEKSGDSPEWLRYTLLFILAYLLGLIWKMFMDWVFKDFRNNIKHIEISYEKSIGKEMKYRYAYLKKHNNDSGKNPISNAKKERFCNLKEIYMKAYKADKDENKAIERKYYHSYYYLQKEGGLGSVPIIERQIAFVRNILLIIPLLITSVFNVFQLESLPFVALITLSCCFIVFLLCWLHKAQSKVYELIFEGAYYYGFNQYIPDEVTKQGERPNACLCTSFLESFLFRFLLALCLVVSIAYFMSKQDFSIESIRLVLFVTMTLVMLNRFVLQVVLLAIQQIVKYSLILFFIILYSFSLLSLLLFLCIIFVFPYVLFFW